MDLDLAIQSHSGWKIKFRTAISKKEVMDAMTIAKDNCCELGKWLHGEGKAQLGSLNCYADCVAKHAAFHIEAGKVANMINAKKFNDAQTMIDANTPYAKASLAAINAIMKLKLERQSQ
ncbi:MAG: CZB domain-containing protein [Sideroxydans sp.]|nr:CZB domain-containing protein [Sideroxydans sp.]